MTLPPNHHSCLVHIIRMYARKHLLIKTTQEKAKQVEGRVPVKVVFSATKYFKSTLHSAIAG